MTLSLHPPNSSYQAYDYKALGMLADRIVIMAYEYNPQTVKKPEPIDKVTAAVREAKKMVPKEKLVPGIMTAYETPQTLLAKVGVAKRESLNGIAIWRLGINSAPVWNMLRSAIKTRY